MVAFYKHDIAPWMDGTEDLSDGAYRAYHVICQLIYLNEGPITLNEHGIAGRCKQSIRALRKNLDELVRSGKLTLENGRISNSRATLELENIGKNRENAAKGGEKSGEVRKASSKALKTKEVGEAPLPEDRSLIEKTREESSSARTREGAAAADDSRQKFEKIETACLAALPPEAVWPIKTSIDLSEIHQCIAAGADLERDVVPAIREISKRQHKAGKRIVSWRFFADEINSRAKTRKVSTSVVTRGSNITAETWETVAGKYAASQPHDRFWPSSLGPPPGRGGCDCPADILRAHGISPDTGEVMSRVAAPSAEVALQ